MERAGAATPNLRVTPRGSSLGAALCLAVTVALAGCAARPASEPLETSRRFLAALEAGDVESALDLSWPAVGRAEAARALANLRATTENLASGRLRIEAMESRTAGDWAVVVLRVTQRLPTGEATTLRAEWLRRRGRGWRVVARSRLAEPGLGDLDAGARGELAEWFRVSNAELSRRWLGSSAGAGDAVVSPPGG
jgi:hypothetical protein